MATLINSALGLEPLQPLLARLTARNPDLRFVRDTVDKRIRLRLLKDRQHATWEVLAGQRWRRVAEHPGAVYSDIHSRIDWHVGRVISAEAAPGKWGRSVLLTAGDLLRWYRTRHYDTRTIKQLRKDAVRWHIDAWLLPQLGHIPFDDLTKAVLDESLVRPLMQEVAPATAKAIFCTWAAALRAARDDERLPVDKLGGVTWRSFKVPVGPKPARLFPESLPMITTFLVNRWHARPRACTLALLMLLHGTRIGETRQARWDDFDLEQRVWVIPASRTKTGVRHVLPLTDASIALLRHYRAWQQNRPEAGAYLFTVRGRGPIGHRAGIQAMRRLSGGDWSAHDFRKLMSAYMRRTLELGDFIIDELLNHTHGAIDAAYSQTTFEERKRTALERWHAAIGEHVDLEAMAAKVVRKRQRW